MKPLSGLTALVLAALSATAAADDWPRWCGASGRNVAPDEKGLPAAFQRGKTSSSKGTADLSGAENVRWAVKVSSIVYGNPTVADGRVFVGTNNGAIHGDKRFRLRKGGCLLCLDEATGERLWKLVIPHPEKQDLPFKSNIMQFNFGVIASPAVAGDKVYIIANNGDVLCLDARGLANGNDGACQDEATYMAGPRRDPIELTEADADILWRRSLWDEEDGIAIVPHDAMGSSPLVHGDLLYVTTSNSTDNSHRNVPRPDAPSLVALDRHTGRVVAVDNEKIGHRLWHGLWSSPNKGTVDGRTLIFFGAADGFLYAFAALDGIPEDKKPVHLERVWKYDCNPPTYRYRDGKEIDYYSGDKRKIRKYKERGNKNDRTFLGPSQIIATPVFHDGRVYLPIGQDPAHGNGIGLLHCIDATKTGDVTKTGAIWTYDGIQRSISTVAVADGLVYAPDITGELHCLDAGTGKVCWKHDGGREAWGGPAVADGKVYFNARRSFTILSAGREKQVLHHESRLGSEASPIAANGAVYVVLKGWLWCLKRDG